MIITCPHCGYFKDVDESNIPFDTTTARCLSCGQKFPFTLARQDHSKKPTSFIAQTATNEPKSRPYVKPDNLPPLPGTSPGSDGTPINAKASFSGTGLSIFGIYFKMYFFAILTLGIYYFWGKTKLRQYVYGQTELLKEHFTYTGTGKELWLGSVKASVLLLLCFVIPQNLTKLVHPAFLLISVLSMFIIVPLAIVGSKRYRLSRTQWHGAAFRFSGRFAECFKIFVSSTLLNILTLGIYYPFYYARMQKFVRENTCYGSASFRYDGRGGDLLSSFIIMLVLFVPTLGFSWLWYKAKRLRYDWAHTTFEDLKFNCTVTTKKLIFFAVGNTLLIFLTLGLAYPWVVKRRLVFNFDNIEITGLIDFDKIKQSAQTASATGEGLLESFDMDIGYGI